MDVDPDPHSGLGEVYSLVDQLLNSATTHVIQQTYRTDLPELINHAAKFALRAGGHPHDKDRFLVMCSKLARFNKNLVQHMEPWLGQVSPPWMRDHEPTHKKFKLESSLDTELLSSCFWLLKCCPRLQSMWSWAEIFTFLTCTELETRFVVIEILRILFNLSESHVRQLRVKFLEGKSLTAWVIKYNVKDIVDMALLAQDTTKMHLMCDKTSVVTLDHVSLTKVGPSLISTDNLVEVESTKINLLSVGNAVSVGQPVLLVGDVGVGKTSIVLEWGARTGREVLSLQVSDNTDARLLVGLYRCTDIPGQFIWEPGLLTRAVTGGKWLLIEDIDRAPQEVVSILGPLVQEGILTVPSLGGQVTAAPGFQLFLTQREQSGSVREELAKLVRTVNVASLKQEELKTVISTRFPNLKDLTEKILRMFSIILSPLDHTDFPDPVKLLNTLRSGRLVSVRDLIKWCKRAHDAFIMVNNPTSQQLPEILYQDAVDILCRFIPDRDIRQFIAQEIAFTLNISKDQASYFSNSHKPLVSLKSAGLQVGRVFVPVTSSSLSLPPLHSVFSVTRHTAILLEAVAMSVTNNEPVLLVGETGVGKTTSVQFLAEKTGRKLKVINMNQQSDSADLLGGFKPVSLSRSLHSLRELFTSAFCDTFSSVDNSKFLGHLDTCFRDCRWEDAMQLMLHTLKVGMPKVSKTDQELALRWKEIRGKIKTGQEMIRRTDLATVFAFIEGTLTEAVKNGDWVLLDEVNMAPTSVLECLSQLLERDGSITLYEAGDYKSLPRHKDFRLFACMNPATDTGKSDLAPGLRNRFTELYCDEMSDKADITMLVTDYLANLSLQAKQISSIVTFYFQAKHAACTTLTNGLGHRPTFSLRTLCRALRIASSNPCGSVKRSLYEAFSLAFLTELDRSSHPIIRDLINNYIVGSKESSRLLKQPIIQSDKDTLMVSEFWVKKGVLEPIPQKHYIITDTVKQNLGDLARIVSLCDHPVLIQGDTSVGKTSLVTYLANITGNKVVRVNNHEHTDIQEYLGSYTSDSSGRLVFKLGVLAEAMQTGSWVILDELNLAPTDVLEALNRVLDDNRELFIPETGETIRAKPGFRLFGTQNPPGMYGGRKVLSRAFRNRFIELHFDQLPQTELEIILTGRCCLPASYSKKMVKVLGELQKFRKGSAAFAGKEGFITLRDLFRWAERYRQADQVEGFYDWDRHLAEEGYLVLAARVRNLEEDKVILDILEKVFKRKVEIEELFSLTNKTSPVTRPLLEQLLSSETTSLFPNVAWTFDMRRLAVLLGHAWYFKEPVLLVGETGCGKTTVVELIARLNKIQLYSLNCHNNTESSDFLGGLRPDRGEHTKMLFQWVDGPLVQAMRSGGVFLADEISLADDSVLERMNSVLEPEREVLLAEKIGQEMDGMDDTTEKVVAMDSFKFVGTMNPGGDYGKKELSPALKNRFTEIWCPNLNNSKDLLSIIERNLSDDPTMEGVSNQIVEFVEWFKETSCGVVSIRDVLAWVMFINTVVEKGVGPEQALWEGAHLVWLDGLQLEGGYHSAGGGMANIMKLAKDKLRKMTMCESELNTLGKLQENDNSLKIGPFVLQKKAMSRKAKYSFQAETTTSNIGKILRGLQIAKPILLEGSPGIGKTSLVEALASRIGEGITRINLSDQTDVADLFGSDLPVEGGKAGQFQWRNGPFLDAMERGHWILLDELNLASQSVLEGLNAVFDHRNEVFIPELDRTFPVHPNTRIFGCQNPISEGGDRKGLPKSFLNRFSKVFMSGLSTADYEMILHSMYPDIEKDLVSRMVKFSSRLEEEVIVNKKWGQSGAPWEFNLRDLLRWCQAMQGEGDVVPGRWVRVIYGAKMRTETDMLKVLELYKENFEPRYPLLQTRGAVWMDERFLNVGEFQLERLHSVGTSGTELQLLACQREIMEMVAGCVRKDWPVVITGGSQTGKTAIVHLLAQLVGVKVETLSLNASTDTMELLGGFEQADIDRSVGDLWAKIVVWVRSVMEELLLENRIEEGLLFMQRFLQLDQQFRDRSLKRKRKEQVKVMSEVILSVRANNIRVVECEQLLVEVGKLHDNKQGTFEWIDSVLVRALMKGSWLVLDNANSCSASVLDRLNCLLEDGGKLVVSERGVLGDEVITVARHKDFRVFLLYDPSRGEISRAMRNRAVEIHVSPPTLSTGDQQQLLFAGLGTAGGSANGVTCGEKIIKGVGGLQDKKNLLTTLRQDVLAGGALECCNSKSSFSLHQLERRVVSVLSNSGLAVTESVLNIVLLQVRSLLIMVEEDNRLASLAVEQFMHYMSSIDVPYREMLLNWLVGEGWGQLARQLGGNKLVCDKSGNCWDWRLLPPSAIRNSYKCSENISNRIALILKLMVETKGLNEKMSSLSQCLFMKYSISSVSSGLDDPILTKFPPLMHQLLSTIQSDLTIMTTTPLHDPGWICLDQALLWLHHLVMVGLDSPLTKDTAESMARSVTVHWNWVYKKLRTNLAIIGCTNACDAMDQFDKLIKSTSQYTTKSMSKLKRILGCMPMPPSSPSDCLTMSLLTKLSSDPMMSIAVHRGRYLSLYATDINKNLLLFKNGGMIEEEVIKDVEMMVKKYQAKVHQDSPVLISPDSFLTMQLWALSEQLSLLQNICLDQQSLSLQHRVLLHSSSKPPGWDAACKVFSILNSLDRPGVELLHRTEYDPLRQRLDTVQPENEAPNCLIGIFSRLVNVRDASGSTAIIMAEQKIEQIREMKEILKTVKFEKEEYVYDDILSEIKFLVEALIIYHHSTVSDNLNMNIQTLLESSSHFQGFSSILTEILDILKTESIPLMKLYKLEMLLNCMKMQLFSLVGPIDPAEKQALKHKYAVQGLEVVKDRLKVTDIFSKILGGTHPHTELLGRTEEMLDEEVGRRRCLTAVRGEDENFMSLSKDLTHFVQTVGSYNNIMRLFSGMETDGNTLAETRLWVKSVHTFVKNIMKYSTFPDLVMPVAEAVSRLIKVMNSTIRTVQEKQLRNNWRNLDRTLVNLATIDPNPAGSILSAAEWILKERVGALFDDKAGMLLLKSSLVTSAQSSEFRRDGKLVKEILDRLLSLWREEEELKEEKKAEAEAMYRTKTMCTDEDEDAEAEAEYRKLFPTFNEMFSDLIQEDRLTDTPTQATKDPDKQPGNTDNSTQFYNIVGILQKFLLHRQFTEEELQAVVETQFVERYRLVSRTITSHTGMSCSSLEKEMIPAIVSMITVTLKQNKHGVSAEYDFYSHSNLEQSSLVKPLLQVVMSRISNLLEQFPENPVLLQIMKIKYRITSISANAPLSQFLTGLELLLTSCQEWQKNAHKGVSLQAEMEKVTELILSWRKLELSGWKVLLHKCLSRIRNQAANYWLHVVGAVMECGTKKEEVVRTLVRFMEAGSIADFQSRLDILKSVGILLDLVGSKKVSILAALRNLHTYYDGLNYGVEQVLQQRLGSAESKVKEFMKLARWKDTSFWSVKGIVDKTRQTLHKTLREYQKSISVPCKSFFTETTVDTTNLRISDGTARDVVCEGRWDQAPISDRAVTSVQGKHLGDLKFLDKRASKWVGKILVELRQVEVVSDLADLLPSMITEMDKLRSLTVDKTKNEQDQKKQAGFIQQRKRAGLNDLFKTLQNFGLSYRYGLTSCTQVDTYKELFSHAQPNNCSYWDKSEKYFFKCFSRFRQLIPLLDRQLPPDVSPVLGERFQGFSQHMLSLAIEWREMAVRNFTNIDFLTETTDHFKHGRKFDYSRNGDEWRAMVEQGLDAVDSCLVSARQRMMEYEDLENLKHAVDKTEILKKKLETKLKDPHPIFVESVCKVEVCDWSATCREIIEIFESCKAAKKFHPVEAIFGAMVVRIASFQQKLDSWVMGKPAKRVVVDDGSFNTLLDRQVVKCLMGIQESLKKSKEFLKEDISWMDSMKTLVEMVLSLKTGQVKLCFEKVITVLRLVAGLEGSAKMFVATQNVACIAAKHLDLAKSVQNILVLTLLQFNKFLSVLLKIFNEIAVNGFCPVKEVDEDSSKTSDDFKSSEEETGLGQGEGSKDVSDQIDNEDMLDGAYQNPEDANDKEDQDNKEEDNGIEMSDNFESNLQDKKDDNEKDGDDEDKEDNENELDDESGEVEGNEDLDKDMWGDEDEDDKNEELEESEEKGKSEENEDVNLSAKDEKEKADQEKRQRKEEEKDEEAPEFDDHQTDPYHGEDKQIPEPEAFDLPESMDLDDKEQEDNFEEGHDNEPETMPDFEEEQNMDECEDPDEEEQGKADIEKFDDGNDVNEDKIDENINTDGTEEPKEEEAEELKIEDGVPEEHSGMDVDEQSGQEALEANKDLDQDKKDQGSEGLNEDKSSNSSTEKSFGIKGKEDETDEEAEAGVGTSADQEKSLADTTDKAERLDIVEGEATGKDNQGQASIFQHVKDQKEEDKSAIDKADEKEIKEQILPDDWDMEHNKEQEQNIPRKQEEEFEKEKIGEKSKKKSDEDMETEDEKGERISTPGEFTPTYNISRGAESLIARQQFTPVARQMQELDTSLSLEPIQLTDNNSSDLPVLTHLSHQLCEQLRLILEPTKASKLQGDFRTGKRLNMRKIIPYIASQFKKDKIWLRRVKPNKREFQILVALDDSSSMSDNQSREIALSSLNTLSSALALLEAGQLGVLRFGKSAEVIHSFGAQWSQSAGHKIQNQFTFEQKETSLVSLLNLSTQLFTRNTGSAGRNLTVSQLLIIVSDGRGVFHEGREKVMQAVMKARQAGYFCLFLIVENPSAPDSVLDIRLPVFSGGKLVTIDSYMDHFPFQHYIVLRDIINLPHTLSDALRQWFELVTS